MDFWFRVIVSLARKDHKYDFHNKAIEGNGIDIGMGIDIGKGMGISNIYGMGIPFPISKVMVQP